MRPPIASVAAVLLLLVPGVLSFGPVFDGVEGYVAAWGGVLLGVGIAVVARWRQWALASTVAVTAAAYLLFGGVFALRRTTIAGFIPTVDTLLRLVPLSVQAWRDLLTVNPPASGFIGPAVVPYLAGLVLGLLAGWFALHPRRYAWALAPAFGLLAVGILWGLWDAPLAAPLGVGFGAVALIWLFARRTEDARRASNDLLASGATPPGRRLGGATALVAAGVVAGLAAAPALGANIDRRVLRDVVSPPLDVQAYASPLTTYRYLELEAREVTLFTVTGLPASARIRLATLDSYDGYVYRVAEDSAGFLRLGERNAQASAPGTPVTLDVAVQDYAGVWLPGGGDVRALQFTGPRATTQAEGLHYNVYGGTLLTTAGVAKGDAYTVQVVLPPQPTVADAELRLADASTPITDKVPDDLATLATELAGDAATPGEQLRRLEQQLREIGYYSDGSDGKSRAGHTSERIASMLTAPQLVGDDEQYAVAMALMARQLGIPARVVMGFYPEQSAPGALDVTGEMAHVWVEAPFEGVGWLSYDPTPDRDKELQTEVPKPKPIPKPQVVPPPAPPPNVAVGAQDIPGDDRVEQDRSGLELLLRIARIIGIVLLGATLVAGPFLLIGALKTRRRARRRTAPDVAARFSGGWAELVDAATDHGSTVSRVATRREAALALAAQHPTADPLRIAARADAGVFGAGAPSPEAAEILWQDVDHARAAMMTGLSRWRRFRATYSLRSLTPRLTFTRRPPSPPKESA